MAVLADVRWGKGEMEVNFMGSKIVLPLLVLVQ